MSAQPRRTDTPPETGAIPFVPVDLSPPDAAAVTTAFAFAHHQLSQYLMAHRDKACVLCDHPWGGHRYEFVQDGFRCSVCRCLSKDQTT